MRGTDLTAPTVLLCQYQVTHHRAISSSPGGASAPPADAKQAAKEPKKKYVFSEEPIPLDKLKSADARVHFVVTEMKLSAGVLKDVDGTLIVDSGQLAFEGRAKGGIEGTLDSALKLKSTSGAADLKLNLALKNLRAGPGAGAQVYVPNTTPPAHTSPT